MKRVPLMLFTGFLILGSISCTPEQTLQDIQDEQACCEEGELPPPPPPPTDDN